MADPLDKRYAKYKEPFMKPARAIYRPLQTFLADYGIALLADIWGRLGPRKWPWSKPQVCLCTP